MELDVQFRHRWFMSQREQREGHSRHDGALETEQRTRHWLWEFNSASGSLHDVQVEESWQVWHSGRQGLQESLETKEVVL